MVEVAVTGGELNLFFELVYRAGSLNGFDGSTLSADEVIAMLSGDDQGEVGGALVQPKSAQNAFVGKTLKQSEYSRLITLVAE